MDVELEVAQAFPISEGEVDEYLSESNHIEDVIDTACRIVDEDALLLIGGVDQTEYETVVVPKSLLMMSDGLRVSLEHDGYGKAAISNLGMGMTYALLEWLYAKQCPDLNIVEWTNNFLRLYDDKMLAQILTKADEMGLPKELIDLAVAEYGRRMNEFLAKLPKDFNKRLDDYLQPRLKNTEDEKMRQKLTYDFLRSLKL